MIELFEPGKSYWLPLDQVIPDEFVFREKIEGPEFEELKQSMAERGQLQPAVVRVFQGTQTDAKVTLLIGHRRYQAARELGWGKIWCTPFFGHGDFDDLASALVENIQRLNLAPLEEARAIQQLIKVVTFSGPGLSEEKAQSLTQEEIAKGVGKSQPYISDLLRIATLTPEELSKLSESDKLKKDKLLRLLKSREPQSQKPPGPAPDPVNYHFKGSRLTFRGSIDFEKDDLDSVIAKIEEMLVKVKEKRASVKQ